jgi:hypothetical protein
MNSTLFKLLIIGFTISLLAACDNLFPDILYLELKKISINKNVTNDCIIKTVSTIDEIKIDNSRLPEMIDASFKKEYQFNPHISIRRLGTDTNVDIEIWCNRNISRKDKQNIVKPMVELIASKIEKNCSN